MSLHLYNTLSRKKEIFKPISNDIVKIYTCGPTVYNFAHIGNLRSYIFPDILNKTLKHIGYKVNHIINITDVGHLTSDADFGDDKIEKAAKETGKTAWDISKYYADVYKEDIAKLNITFPDKYTYATEYIQEQIDLVKTLEEKGLAYQTSDGIYYDTSKFPDYGKMAKLDIDGLDEGLRIDFKEKKNKTDFALWKLSPEGTKRQMEWDSPWGIGFPGWHVECSAMSMAELGKQLDIHTGGTDHIPVHHTNEIAQSEGANGTKFVNYWLHGAFLVLGEDERMGKSKGNFLGLKELIEKGYNPLAYKYMSLISHYRNYLNFSFSALDSASTAYTNLKKLIRKVNENLDNKSKTNQNDYDNKIETAFLDDLNTPKAIGIIWTMLQDEKLDNKSKIEMIKKYDQILSLNLLDFSDLEEIENVKIPDQIIKLAEERLEFRKNKDYAESDRLKKEIIDQGFEIKDTKAGFEITLKS